MARENGRAGRSRWWWVGGAVVVVVLVGGGAALWVHAPTLYASIKPEHGRAQAVALTRTGILTAGVALLALAGVAANLIETRRTNELTRIRDEQAHTRELDSQAETRRINDLTHARELYVRAVDQIGSETLEVRLGGIYALERLARDSANDQAMVVEVLSTFARTRQVRSADLPKPPPPDPRAPPPPRVRALVDMRAAVAVLARLPVIKGVPRADLEGDWDTAFVGPATLAGLHVPTGGSLAGVWLKEAEIGSARMSGADLSHAMLTFTDLTLADLTGANLTGAELYKAKLSGAKLVGADLTNADLPGVDLTDVNLTGANLTGAQLFGADLTRTRGDLTQDQVNAARGNQRTLLPARLARPPSWPPYDPDSPLYAPPP